MLEQLTSDDLKQSFRQPADADAIVGLADAYVEGIRRGTFKQQGYSQSMYGMSKIADMSYTRWLARQVKDKVIPSCSLGLIVIPVGIISLTSDRACLRY